MITIAKLEKAIHSKFVVEHLEIEDVSSGCGESYSILLVSDVSKLKRPRCHYSQGFQDFEGKSTLQRHRLSE